MRVSSLTFALTFFALAGCSAPKPACSQSTCAGCCDASGTCVSGLVPDACGTFGAACRACTGFERCSFGVCQLGGTGGGAGTTGGGVGTTGGGAASGGGVGTGGGVGAGGGSATGGGSAVGGGSATGGGGGPAIGGGSGTGGGSGGSCNAGNCAGCCANNVCQLGSTSTFCGVNGNACIGCGAGLTCNNGQCVAPPPCNATTCPGGCCNNGVCQSGNTSASCGTNGNTCLNCGTQSCQSGQCTTVCGPGNCNGCCSNNTCVAGNTTSACGLGGGACNACGSGSSCSTFGTCTTPTGGLPTGSPCTTASQCAGDNTLGLKTCRSPTQSDGGVTGWVGGYCSATCISVIVVSNCPSSSDYCDDISCHASCTGPGSGQSNCRAGYVCDNDRFADGGVVASSAHCVPNCNNAPSWSCGNKACLANGYCAP